MDPIFNELVKYGRKMYIEQLAQNEQNQILDIINYEGSYAEKYQKFLDVVTADPKIAEGLINPFFVGMGNPYHTGEEDLHIIQAKNNKEIHLPNEIECSILFIGQELGFNIELNRWQLFFEEQVFHHDILLNPDIDFFNPYTPNAYRKINNHGHTWGVYSKFMAGIYDNYSQGYNYYFTENNFGHNSFFTELYDVPRPKHQPAQISNARMNFFQSESFREFIKRFKYIIIGDSNFFHNYQHLLNTVFGINNFNELNPVQSATKRCRILSTETQKIAISNFPLSNMWAYDYINEITKNLREN